MKTVFVISAEIKRWDEKSSSISFVPSFHDYRPEQMGFSVTDHKET
jgi:hypothetical protein